MSMAIYNRYIKKIATEKAPVQSGSGLLSSGAVRIRIAELKSEVK
jgi:hypothetical protein